MTSPRLYATPNLDLASVNLYRTKTARTPLATVPATITGEHAASNSISVRFDYHGVTYRGRLGLRGIPSPVQVYTGSREGRKS